MASWTPPDNPIERDDGSLVCQKHGLNICAYCCVDYSFILSEERSDYDDDDEEDDTSEEDELSGK